jgi:hypothetical protein
MARTRLILPQADAACGKLFYGDRRTADGHRIALEVWNRATGRIREGYHLAVVRCRRCGGFHIGRRPIDKTPALPTVPPRELAVGLDTYDRHEPTTHLGHRDAYADW